MRDCPFSGLQNSNGTVRGDFLHRMAHPSDLRGLDPSVGVMALSSFFLNLRRCLNSERDIIVAYGLFQSIAINYLPAVKPDSDTGAVHSLVFGSNSAVDLTRLSRLDGCKHGRDTQQFGKLSSSQPISPCTVRHLYCSQFWTHVVIVCLAGVISSPVPSFNIGC